MNNIIFYPTKILSIRNTTLIFITGLIWYRNPEISLLFLLFLISYILFNINTYKVEKNDAGIIFSRLFNGTNEFEWVEITKIDYNRDMYGGFIWRGFFIYIFVDDTYYRFNIKCFYKSLFDEIKNHFLAKIISLQIIKLKK